METRSPIRRRAIPAIASLFISAITGAMPASAAPPDPVDDGFGREWRQLYETSALTWSQVAQICPQDGETPCSGSIGSNGFDGWVWGTAAQVVELMGNYAPAILTADPPSVGGAEYFGLANGFLADMRWTFYVAGYNFYRESTAGWTASVDGAGLPMVGSVGYGWWPPSGGFDVSGVADEPNAYRGVFLWRPSGQDHSPPAITPSVVGTLGANGWYVSDVSVTWSVQDPDSEISALVGCDPAVVGFDTPETAFVCQATSAGGTASAAAIVKRDITPPTVTCPSPAPVFQLFQVGALVTASVADPISGAATAPAQAIANTNAPGTFTVPVTGADRAGNRATAVCSYQVAGPTCRGLSPTIVGTASNDVITGTSGPDVIVGLGGADTINGKGGDDVICGGDGPDTIDGGDGNDWIDGGASNDDLSGGNGNDTIDGGAGSDSIRGGNGTDTCTSGEVRSSSCEP